MPTVPSGDIYFETHGAGTPVMLVPGLGGVGSYWNPNIPAFAQKYQVVLHDHRGTGQSSRSRIHYTVDQMTDDLLAVPAALVESTSTANNELPRHQLTPATGGRRVTPSKPSKPVSR
jgi:pimeloyl-ACP methyl ester carboxylesterase